MNDCEIKRIISSLEWQPSRQDPDIFYRYLDSGLWYPDTVHKPFLRPAVEEHEKLLARMKSVHKFFENGDAG